MLASSTPIKIIMANVINWFEIPAKDMERAKQFYATVLGGELHEQDLNGFRMAFLPMEGEGVGGALVQHEAYTPNASGALVYLNGGNDLSPFLDRVEEAGGKVLQGKTKITDEIGYMAVFLDSEGNRIAFHSHR